MADSKVSDLVDEALSTSTNDWMYIASWNGVDWTSKKIKPENVGGENFANANLTLTGNRSHDGDSNRLTMAKFKDMTFETFIAPTLGLASLNFNGYGNTASDLTHEFNSDNGTTMRMYGDNSGIIYGNFLMNANTQLQFGSSSQYIRKNPSANGTEFINNGGSISFGFNNGQVYMSGNFDYDSIQCVNTQTTSYFTQQNGSYAWRYGKNGNDGSIRGSIGVGFTNTEIISIKQTDGEVEFLIGKLKSVLQVGNTGLSAGQWYQDTSANVLSNGDYVIAIKQ